MIQLPLQIQVCCFSLRCRELQKLHLCHADVLSRACGTDASRVMSGLVHEALNDPFYLRLGHRADCSLHQTHSTLPSATPKLTPDDSSADNDAIKVWPTSTLTDVSIVPDELEIPALVMIEGGDKTINLRHSGSRRGVSLRNMNADRAYGRWR
jgi:hypothetical protein